MFSTILAYASKKFAVYVDPKIVRVQDVLPGINCGACEPECPNTAIYEDTGLDAGVEIMR